jgi:oligopeptide transport system ATP-binding protein
MAKPGTLLEADGLGVSYAAANGNEVCVVAELEFELQAGRTLGIVGESGAGKTQALLALMGLLPAGARVRGSLRFEGEELVGHPERIARLRGRRLALVPQDTGTALNPYLTLGTQMYEVLAVHAGLHGRAARARALELLEAVQITDAQRRLAQYPHELSGGMRQRALIALALLVRPTVLLADEPTTALDVTVQAQILALLEALRDAFGLAIVIVSHDLGVVAHSCDSVIVMYAGRAIERGDTVQVLRDPQHPYTRALLRAATRLDGPRAATLATLAGVPATPASLPAGCAFHPRCDQRFARCERERPEFVATSTGHAAACHLWT